MYSATLSFPLTLARAAVRVARKFRPSRSVEYFRHAVDALPVVTVEAVTRGKPLLVLAPHPDDESLGCGGIIAAARAQGTDVWVMILTDGVGSHPRSPSYPPDRLKALRETEAARAVAVLGVAPDRLVFLGYRDGSGLRPRRATQARLLAARIAELTRLNGVETIITTARFDPHVDHKAAYRVAKIVSRRTGVRLLTFPIWVWVAPGRDKLPIWTITGRRVDIGAHLPTKGAAIACHQSQVGQFIADDPGHVPLTPAFLQAFAKPFEILIDD